jgi:two-component system, cell cycle response regulator
MLDRRTTALISLALAGIALLFQVVGGNWRSWGVSLLICLLIVIWALFLRSLRKRPAAQNEDAPPPSPDASLQRSIEKAIDEKAETIGGSVLGTNYGHGQRKEIEHAIDLILDDYIAIIRAYLDTHTVAIFFPTDDNGFKLRRYFSNCDYINKEAVIYPGVGVIGSFLKDGLKQLNLQEIITDSMTLYYYTKDAGIRSLMASPIIADKAERGTIIVDSTEKKHFSDEDHAFLSKVASLVGSTVFYAYSHSVNKLKHERLVAMSSIEKDFFTNLEIEAILDLMVNIVPYAIPCDRLTISLKSDDGKTAIIRRAWGQQTQGLLKHSFSLGERTLVGLLYYKNLCFYRDFSPHHYETRYWNGEPKNDEFASFLAFPFGVESCIGALLLESFRHEAFTDAHRGLLMRLSTSAGLAIEKVKMLEQAQAMATHDGLTGLFNHRHFQQMLKEEINRASRYAEPLALVISDIDFFKKLNDNYGHPFGDIVLKGVAEKLAESIRAGIDIAARYGGEEFALILVKSDKAQALDTTERIRQIISQTKYKNSRGEDVGATMSFGIAIFGEHAKDQDTLIKRADKALYKAKENGRNRVEVFWAEG